MAWISLPSSNEGQISEVTAEMAVGNKGIPTYRKQEQTRQGTIWPDECGRWKKMCQAAKLEAVKTKRYDPNRENCSEVVPVHRSKKNDRYHSDLSRFFLVQEQPNTSYNKP
ncbi:hypothetical protein B0T13DRAFT_491885 [Neurospora crassa]|nr:hypothetical protein B0T13DRAFT_491885 [Neurospora crassa]